MDAVKALNAVTHKAWHISAMIQVLALHAGNSSEISAHLVDSFAEGVSYGIDEIAERHCEVEMFVRDVFGVDRHGFVDEEKQAARAERSEQQEVETEARLAALYTAKVRERKATKKAART